MKAELNHIASRFSAASGTYDRAALVQPMAAEKLCELLAGLEEPDSILEIGCGTGQLTVRLARLFPAARIVAVDISEKMLEQARLKLGCNSKLCWLVSDIFNLPSSSHPLIVSCSALHWLDPLAEGLRELASRVSEAGRLVMGLMVEGTLAELRSARLRAAPKKPPLAELPSVAAVRSALESGGLEVVDERIETIILNYSSASELLLSLHEQGVTGGRISVGAAPLCKGELSRLIDYYDAAYLCDGGVGATYRVAYFSAKRPE